MGTIGTGLPSTHRSSVPSSYICLSSYTLQSHPHLRVFEPQHLGARAVGSKRRATPAPNNFHKRSGVKNSLWRLVPQPNPVNLDRFPALIDILFQDASLMTCSRFGLIAPSEIYFARIPRERLRRYIGYI